MAGELPLELQQHVFSYLDPRSFYAARKVCRWWRHASDDSVTLAHQIRQMPVEPLVSAKTMDSGSLQSLYDEAAQGLMLGMSATSKAAAEKSLSERVSEAKVTLSRDGRRAATLNDRQITLYNLTTEDSSVVCERPLNDLRNAVGGGPWFKCAPSSVHELALSADGSTLAVALDRTIQIYDLKAGKDSWPVCAYISSASGHYIAGLQFQHNDSLLRVQLSNKGAVVYLGTPSSKVESLQHWQGKSGLKHAFLDSTVLSRHLRPLAASGVPEVLAGLQLLRPFAQGWLFAAQKRCVTAGSACYCIGYVPSSEVDGHVMTAEKTAYVLAELPSSTTSTPLPEMVYGNWHDLPSAHVQHPHFSLSENGRLLALSENVGVPAPAGLFSRVFVFSLPNTRSLLSTFERLRSAENDLPQHGARSCPDIQNIQRLPLCIGSVSGKVIHFDFDHIDKLDACDQYRLSATTETGAKTWSLLDS